MPVQNECDSDLFLLIEWDERANTVPSPVLDSPGMREMFEVATQGLHEEDRVHSDFDLIDFIGDVGYWQYTESDYHHTVNPQIEAEFMIRFINNNGQMRQLNYEFWSHSDQPYRIVAMDCSYTVLGTHRFAYVDESVFAEYVEMITAVYWEV